MAYALCQHSCNILLLQIHSSFCFARLRLNQDSDASLKRAWQIKRLSWGKTKDLCTTENLLSNDQMYAYSEDRKGFDVSHFLSIFMGDYGYAVCVGRFEVWSMKFEDTHTNRVSNTFSAKSRLRQKTKPTIFSFSFQCKFENVEGDEDTRTQGKKNWWNSMSEQDGWKEDRAIL